MMDSLDSLNMNEMLNSLTDFITNAENVLAIIGGLVVCKAALNISYKFLRSFWTYVVPRYFFFFYNLCAC